MRIVDRKTFLSLPPNTVFSKYDSGDFGELCIKMESVHNDFWYVSFEGPLKSDNAGEFIDACGRAEGGESVEMDFDTEIRDANFNDGQLFAVLEPADVTALIRRLSACVP